jgi:hypothetical protein
LFRSNSSTVVESFENAYGHWRDLNPSVVSSAPPRCIDFIVHPHTPGDFPGGLVYRSHGGRMLVGRSADLIAIDIDGGSALCFVAPEALAEDGFLETHLLTSAVLSLATGADRHPVHAACVVGRSRPVLLAAPSGVGKSTLCFAALRAGFAFLADDSVFVSVAGTVRAWQGIPALRLPEELTRQHPDLQGLTSLVDAGGRRKRVVVPSTLPGMASRLYADSPAVCLLRRSADGRSRVVDVDAGVVVEALTAQLESGFDLSRDPVGVAEALAAGGSYVLHVGLDPEEAVALLREIAD